MLGDLAVFIHQIEDDWSAIQRAMPSLYISRRRLRRALSEQDPVTIGAVAEKSTAPETSLYRQSLPILQPACQGLRLTLCSWTLSEQYIGRGSR